jgi:type IV pilus assembly protein PilM
MAKGVWGIDVSKYSAKAVRIEAGTLTTIGVFPYGGETTGEPVSPADLDLQIKSTLGQIKQNYKIGSEPVHFSLPSHSTFNRLIKLPPVDDSKIPEIVRYEAQSQIPFAIDEVIWDYQYVERAYGPGEEKEVILFAIKKDIVEQFLANIAELGFVVEGIQFSPVALFNFLAKDQELQGACVALDMGGDNTDLIVIDGNKFWVRNLPITGNDITKALQKAFNIPFEEAEKLKLHAGQSQQAQKIFNAIQPVLRDLVNEINRSMGYYKSISKTSKFEKIILLGDSTKTLNFQKFISQSLQLPAVRVQKLNTVAVGGSIDPGELGEHLSTLGTALGLAVQGTSSTPNRINLLPESERAKKELRKKRPFVIAAVALLYALAGLVWHQQRTTVDRLRDTEKRGNAVLKRADQAEEELKVAKKYEDVTAQLEPLAKLTFERELILKIMDMVNPNIPKNGELTDETKKLWIVDAKFEEKDAALVGVAASQMPSGPSRPFPASKVLITTLEVVLTKRSGDTDARNVIVKTLLNYNEGTRKPADGNKPCVVSNESWQLPEGRGWKVEQDGTDLWGPVPKNFISKEKEPEGEKGKFWRYRVTLEIPVGDRTRKALAAAEKAPAKGGTPEKGAPEKKP